MIDFLTNLLTPVFIALGVVQPIPEVEPYTPPVAQEEVIQEDFIPPLEVKEEVINEAEKVKVVTPPVVVNKPIVNTPVVVPPIIQQEIIVDPEPVIEEIDDGYEKKLELFNRSHSDLINGIEDDTKDERKDIENSLSILKNIISNINKDLDKFRSMRIRDLKNGISVNYVVPDDINIDKDNVPNSNGLLPIGFMTHVFNSDTKNDLSELTSSYSINHALYIENIREYENKYDKLLQPVIREIKEKQVDWGIKPEDWFYE